MRDVIFAAFIVLTFGHVLALAHSGATGVVKQRMDGMKSMKEAMAVIGPMIKGDLPLDREAAAEAAEGIALHASQMGTLFPDNQTSRAPVSEATEAVWQQPERFARLSAELEETALKLAELSRNAERDEIALGFMETGKVCSACHEDFRLKKQQ